MRSTRTGNRVDDHGGDRHMMMIDSSAERARIQDAEICQGHGREIAGKGADHEDLAVGEVDHAQDAVDHRVAQGDQRVDAARAQPVEGKLIHCRA